MDQIEDTDSIHSASTEILLNENHVNSKKKEEIIETEFPRKMDKVHRDSTPDIIDITDESDNDSSSSDCKSGCSSDCSCAGENYVITITTTSSKSCTDKNINNEKTTTSTITIKQRLNNSTSGGDVINEINIGNKFSDSNNREKKKSKKREKKRRQDPSKKQKSHNVQTTTAQSESKQCKEVVKMKEYDSLDSSSSREIEKIRCSNENSNLINEFNVPKNEILLENHEIINNGNVDDLEETNSNFRDQIVDNNTSSIAEKTIKNQAEFQECKPKFERTLNEPEFYTIDDDDLIYVNAKDSSKIVSTIEINTEPIKIAKKLTKYSESAVVDLTECNDDDSQESQLFSDNCDAGCRREVGFKNEKNGGKILVDSDIVVLSDSDDNDNPWYRRLLKAQLLRESRKDFDDLKERRENVEEFGKGENMLFRHENVEYSRELSFSSDFNNNEENDFSNNNNNTGEIGEERNKIVAEKQIAVKETVCKEIDENRSNENTSKSRIILQPEKSVYCGITEEKNAEKRAEDEKISIGKKDREEKISRDQKRTHDETRDAEKLRDEKVARVEKKCEEKRSRDERKDCDEKKCAEKRCRDENSSNEEEISQAEKQVCDEKQYEQITYDVKRWLFEECIHNENPYSNDIRSDNKCRYEETRANDGKCVFEEKRFMTEKNVYKENQVDDEKRLRDKNRGHREKRSREEKLLSEEIRFAKERRTSDEKRTSDENRIAKERRASEEKRFSKERHSSEENRIFKDKRFLDERKSSEKRSGSERRYFDNKTKKLADKKRSSNEKRSNSERRSYDEKKSRDAIHDRNENRATNMRRTQDERRFHKKKSCHIHERSANRDSASEVDGAKMSEHREKSHKHDVGKQRHNGQEDDPKILDNSKMPDINRSNSRNIEILKDPRLKPNSYPIVILTKLKQSKKGVQIINPPFLLKGDRRAVAVNIEKVSKSPDRKERMTSESSAQSSQNPPELPSKEAGPQLSKRDLARKAAIEKKIHIRDQKRRRVIYPWANTLPISKQPFQKFTSEQRDKIKCYRREMLKKIAERKINGETDESVPISLPVSDENVTGESSAKEVPAQNAKLTKEARGFFLFSKPLERTKKRSTNFKEISLEKRNDYEDCKSTNAEDETNSQDSENEDENSAIQETLENDAEELRIEIDEILESIMKDIEASDVSKAPGMPKTTRRVYFDDNMTKVHVFEIEPGNRLRKFDPKEVTGLQVRKEIETFDETHEKFYPRIEQFLLNIFNWSPRWLEEQFHMETPPPIVDESNLVAMLTKYRTYEEYYKIAEPLLALEMWNGISKDFQFGKNNLNTFSIVANSIHNTPVYPTKEHVSTLTLEIVVSKYDLQSQSHPVSGDLIFFDYLTNTKNEYGFSRWTVFAYVTDLRKTVITPLTHFNRSLIFSVQNPHTLLTYTVMTKALDYTNVQTNIVNSLQRISYLRSNMRIVEALQCLPSSPLMDIILHPNVHDYQLPPANNLESYNLVTKDNLNTKQLEAVIRITNAVVQEIPKICLIQGPPGTGKSRVIVNLITQILYGDNRYNSEKKLKILVCAPSNAAIDEIVLRLLDVRKSFEKENRFNMVRIGQTETMHRLAKAVSVRELARKDVAHTSDANSSSTSFSRNNDENEYEVTKRRRLAKMYRNAEDKLLKNADVITSTLSSCYTNQMESIFAGNDETISVCIVDEATQSAEPETLIPLMLGVKILVLVGDTNQLPATILSQKAKQLGLDQSLFARIWQVFKYETNNPIIQLITQYRMAAPVALFPNNYFYNGALTNAAIMHKLPLHFYRVINLDSRQDRERFCNSNEANFVAMLVYTIIARTNYDDAILPVKVGIITPYNDQKIMLRKKIKERIKQLKDKHNIVYEVNTVDSFQGQERDVIIMSCVRSSGIGFLSDRQRLCVALTRAKHSLILCGNFKTFERDPMWNALLEDAKTRGVYINVNSKANPEDIRSHVIR